MTTQKISATLELLGQVDPSLTQALDQVSEGSDQANRKAIRLLRQQQQGLSQMLRSVNSTAGSLTVLNNRIDRNTRSLTALTNQRDELQRLGRATDDVDRAMRELGETIRKDEQTLESFGDTDFSRNIIRQFRELNDEARRIQGLGIVDTRGAGATRATRGGGGLLGGILSGGLVAGISGGSLAAGAGVGAVIGAGVGGFAFTRSQAEENAQIQEQLSASGINPFAAERTYRQAQLSGVLNAAELVNEISRDGTLENQRNSADTQSARALIGLTQAEVTQNIRTGRYFETLIERVSALPQELRVGTLNNLVGEQGSELILEAITSGRALEGIERANQLNINALTESRESLVRFRLALVEAEPTLLRLAAILADYGVPALERFTTGLETAISFFESITGRSESGSARRTNLEQREYYESLSRAIVPILAGTGNGNNPLLNRVNNTIPNNNEENEFRTVLRDALCPPELKQIADNTKVIAEAAIASPGDAGGLLRGYAYDLEGVQTPILQRNRNVFSPANPEYTREAVGAYANVGRQLGREFNEDIFQPVVRTSQNINENVVQPVGRGAEQAADFVREQTITITNYIEGILGLDNVAEVGSQIGESVSKAANPDNGRVR